MGIQRPLGHAKKFTGQLCFLFSVGKKVKGQFHYAISHIIFAVRMRGCVSAC